MYSLIINWDINWEKKVLIDFYPFFENQKTKASMFIGVKSAQHGQTTPILISNRSI